MSCRGISTIGRSGVAALVALAFVLLALPAAASAADGAISGKVTLAAGGAPVEGAEVCTYTDIVLGNFKCASTAADGSYEIEGLVPFERSVNFSGGENHPFLMASDVSHVPISSGTTTTGVDAALVEGGAIDGKITDALSGAPIEDVEICRRSDPSHFFSNPCPSDASDGKYQIPGLAPGDYELLFRDMEQGHENLILKVSVATGVMTTQNAAMQMTSRISGHVYTAVGHVPVWGTLVCGLPANLDKLRACVETDSSGAYEMSYLIPGEYRVAFSAEYREFGHDVRPEPDGWPTQFWNLKSSLAEAEVIDVPRHALVSGIDGLLGYVPPPARSSAPAATNPGPITVTTKPMPKPRHCGKGKVKKRVKGKARCVRRHARHHRHHHRSRST